MGFFFLDSNYRPCCSLKRGPQLFCAGGGKSIVSHLLEPRNHGISSMERSRSSRCPTLVAQLQCEAQWGSHRVAGCWGAGVETQRARTTNQPSWICCLWWYPLGHGVSYIRSVESCHLGGHIDSQGWLFGSSRATRDFKGQGRVFLNGEEKGVPEVRGSKPKTVESKVRLLDEIGFDDKFMNYCGKPVTSEVTFGQTGFVCGQRMRETAGTVACCWNNGVPLSSAVPGEV